MTSLGSISLRGYRSFGLADQRFDRLSRINLLIGPNNSGKSNVLRFIHDVYPSLARREGPKFQPLDRHFPNATDFRYGTSVSLARDASGNYTEFNAAVRPKFSEEYQHGAGVGNVLRVFMRKAQLDGTDDVWFQYGNDRQVIVDQWQVAFGELGPRELSALWTQLTGRSGGSRDQNWWPESLKALAPNFPPVSVAMIPAIRRVGGKGTESAGFSGEGIIERLARLQNPDVHKQAEKERFSRINKFLQAVTGNGSAIIEIPYERDTINVQMDERVLPLESLGTGIHEVIILAAASTILENAVVCMEEPELHLNPILQKKLVRYLKGATSNQYFITTHSSALMDTPEAEVYHIQLRNGQSVVERVTSDRHRSMVCEDLGYHPSDLLQANCVVWVEGPSDRIYLNYWISQIAPELQEGIHYSIMFYGGRLAAHISGNDLDEAIGDFISLRRLNRRATIVIDSDRSAGATPLNATKARLVEEFNKGPGHAWVTDGREIENYLHPDDVRRAISAVAPQSEPGTGFGRYARMLAVRSRGNRRGSVSKVDVARSICESLKPTDGRFGLGDNVARLVAFIRDSNPPGLS